MARNVHWQKSSFSGGGDGNTCLEIAAASRTLLLREGDEPEQVLAVTSGALSKLLVHVRAVNLR